MNKFIKLTAMGSNNPIYFNVAHITKIELNNFNEAKIYTDDDDWYLVNERIDVIMNLINN